MLENEVLDKDKDAARREELRVPSKDVLRASGQVQSLSRALKLLNALSYHAPGLSLSEVAQEVGLPNSTAHRLLTTLQNERYVRFDNERSVWLIGRRKSLLLLAKTTVTILPSIFLTPSISMDTFSTDH